MRREILNSAINGTHKMARLIYEIKQAGPSGALVDVLTKIITSASDDFLNPIVWTIFDLRWVQSKDGLMQHAILENKQPVTTIWRPLVYKMPGTCFPHRKVDQVIDSIFVGDMSVLERELATGPSEELLRSSVLGLRVFDSSFWQVSSSMNFVNEYVEAEFEVHVEK